MVAMPKRLQYGNQTPSHARSRAQEKETASRFGGKQTPRSGAGYIKGDVRVKGFARIENKTTKHNSYSVSVEDIQKLENAVFGSGEIPFMGIELALGAVKFAVIPDAYLDDLIELIKRKNEFTE